MSLVAFDTLKFANQLQAGNFTPEQAQAMTAAMVEAMAGAELATKHDVVAVKTELKAEAAANKTELKNDIAAVRAEAAANKTELKNDIATVRTELAALEQKMTAGFRDTEQKMTIKLGGMLAIVTGVLLAAIRYLGH